MLSCDLRDLSTPQHKGLRNSFLLKLTPQEADKSDRKEEATHWLPFLLLPRPHFSFLSGCLLSSAPQNQMQSRSCFIWKADLTDLSLTPHLTFSCFRIEIWIPQPASFSGDLVIEVKLRMLCSGLFHFIGIHVQTVLSRVQIRSYNNDFCVLSGLDEPV